MRRADSSSNVQPSTAVVRRASSVELAEQRRRRRRTPIRRAAARAAAGSAARRRAPRAPSGARILGGRELAGGEVEQRGAEAVRVDRRRDARARNAGSRASRYPASVSVPGETTRTTSRRTSPLAFCGSSTCSHDRDAEALAHQPGDVAVGRVVGHAAHRDGAAARVLRPGGQRQLERARGRQRVLVEHLVEVPHAEEDDRVAVLPLGVEVLPHRRRGAGRLSGHGGSHQAAGNEVLAERCCGEYNIEPIGFLLDDCPGSRHHVAHRQRRMRPRRRRSWSEVSGDPAQTHGSACRAS